MPPPSAPVDAGRSDSGTSDSGPGPLDAGGEDAGPSDDAGLDAGQPDAGPDAGTCDNPCGERCCAANQACVDGECRCVPACDGRTCGDDGCGGRCGECAPGTHCTAGTCESDCAAENDTQFCARLGKCGRVSDKDLCDLHRSVDCGGCTTGFTCRDNVCTPNCALETDTEFCARMNVDCGGPVSGPDKCNATLTRTVSRCGDCGVGQRCTSGHCEVCVGEDDPTLCAGHGMNCGSPVLVDSCGDSHQVLSCGTCTTPATCGTNNVCGRPGAPAGDDCSAPIVVAPTPGTQHLTGDMTLFNNDSQNLASKGTGKDAVYTFTLSAPMTFTATAAFTAGSSDWIYLYLRTVCSSPQASQELYAPAYNKPIVAKGLPAGTYYLWLDSFAGDEGPFTLDLTFAVPPTPPPNDNCTSPQLLNVIVGSSIVQTGDSGAAFTDAQGSCASAGPDVVYQFGTSRPQAIKVEVAGTGFSPAVYLRTDCGDTATQLGCHAPSSGSAVVDLPTQPAGTFYVWVDANGSDGGPFTLTVTLTEPQPPPMNDVCPGQPITLASTGTTTYSGDTSWAVNDTTGGCGAMPGGDVFFEVNLSAAAKLVAKVTRAAGAPTDFLPAVYLRQSCTSPALSDQLACATGTGASVSITSLNLQPGLHYLVVDSTSLRGGAFDLALTVDAPVDLPDTCATAKQVAPTLGTQRFTGDMTLATNDGTNLAGKGTGKDMVYTFELRTPMDLVATAAFTASTGDWTYLYLRTVCMATTASEELFAPTYNTPIKARNLQPGTYYLWLDSYSGDEGPFTLDLTFSTPLTPPTNDTCATAELLTLRNDTVTVQGNTGAAASDETTANCSSAGGDVYYSFTTGTDAAIAVAVAPVAFKPSIYLKTACSGGTTLACHAPSTGSAFLSLAVQPAGTYYLVVDTQGTDGGAFTLTVTTTPAQPPPAEDVCPGVRITLGAGAVHLTGETTFATDGGSGTCATVSSPHSGADVVYSFELLQSTRLTAMLRRDPSTPTFQPALYLRMNDCASTAAADEKGCQNASTSGIATLSKTLAAGTYFLVVDGQKATMGKYILDVDARPSIANDDCAAAEEIVFDSNFVGRVVSDTTGKADNAYSSCVGEGLYGEAPDLVYKIILPSEKFISVQLTNSSSFSGGFFIRSTCSSGTTQIACGYNASYGGTSAAITPRLPAGTYYLWVEGDSYVDWDWYEYYYDEGPFALQVTLIDPGQPPAEDTCAAPLALPAFDTSGKATVNGSTLPARDDYAGTCATASVPHNGPDVVYSFSLGSTAMVTAKVSAASTTPGFTPAVYLRGTNCASALAADQYACANGSSGTATAKAALTAGTYYVVVDGVSGSVGEFALEVTLGSNWAPGDSCAMAEPLPLIGTVANITADTSLAGNSGTGTCDSSSSGDVVYTFTVSRESSLEFTVTPSGSAYRPLVYLRRDCADASAANQVYCGEKTTSGAALSGRVPRLAAGTYYLWFDSYSTYTGPFTATVTVQDTPQPPANDVCANAQGLTVDSATGKATATGDTFFATEGGTGTCAAAVGTDVVYVLTTGTPQKAVFKVTRDANSPNFQPVVYVRGACDQADSNAELACAKASSGVATVTINALPAGTWYVWVDGTLGSTSDTGGAFALEVTLTAANGPANDGCYTAEPITGAVTALPGTTLNAGNDQTGSCAYSSGVDVVYALSLAQEQQVTATVTPVNASGYRPAVYLRTACSGTELACGSASSANTPATATAVRAGPGTVMIFVDAAGSSATSGTFNLDITLAAPVPAPANETCRTPITLYKGVDENGDTRTALSDYGAFTSTACSSTMGAPGPDVVYKYTPQANGDFTVTVTPNTSFDAVVWVGSGTCGAAGSCLGFKDGKSAGVGATYAEAVTISGATAGTDYFIFVEGYYSYSSGAFTVRVQ